jgi:hypothetical protein
MISKRMLAYVFLVTHGWLVAGPVRHELISCYTGLALWPAVGVKIRKKDPSLRRYKCVFRTFTRLLVDLFKTVSPLCGCRSKTRTST